MKSVKDPLKPVDVSKLDIVTNRRELRRDLHVFVEYIDSCTVKRAHRDNSLSKADSKRLAKLMTDPGADEEVKQKGYSVWVDLIDRMTLNLGFVDYDTEKIGMIRLQRRKYHPISGLSALPKLSLNAWSRPSLYHFRLRTKTHCSSLCLKNRLQFSPKYRQMSID